MIKLPSGVDLNNLIDDLRAFSWEACDILLYYSQILKDSSDKSNILKNNNIDDPVTFADLKVNEFVINRINEKYKDIDWKILSEENAKTDLNNCDTNSDWLWILDPLDGTKDFIEGTSNYAMHLALNYAMHLALNYKKKPYVGVVLIPEKDELWIADGEKVWSETRDNSYIQPSLFPKNTFNEMVIVISKNHRNQTLKKLIDKVGFKNVIVMGSIGCKIASLLRGESDIYICLSLPGKSSPKDWDFAAPEAILKTAGGAITDLDNQDLTYGTSNFEQGGIIVASNNVNEHSSLCMEIKKVIKKYEIYPI